MKSTTVRFNLVVAQRFPEGLEKLLRDYEGRVEAQSRVPERAGAPTAIVRTYDEALRDISEGLIVSAVRSVYGESMPKTERGMWKRLQEQLIDGAMVLEMDGTAWDWLKRTVNSDKVKVHPDDALKHETLVDAFESARPVQEG